MTGDLCSTGCPQACPVSFQDTRQARLRLIPLICHAESRALKDRRPQLGDPASACRRGGHPDQPGGPRSRAPAGGRGALLVGSDSSHRRRLSSRSTRSATASGGRRLGRNLSAPAGCDDLIELPPDPVVLRDHQVQPGFRAGRQRTVRNGTRDPGTGGSHGSHQAPIAVVSCRPPVVTSILRGLARSATGTVNRSTPSS